jgi:hypothetical protein
LIALPQLIIYGKSAGINDGSYAELSIGSMVFSQASCFQAPITNGQIHIDCPNSDLQISKMISAGIIPKSSYKRDICYFEDYANECSPLLDNSLLKQEVESHNANSFVLTDLSRYYKAGATVPSECT